MVCSEAVANADAEAATNEAADVTPPDAVAMASAPDAQPHAAGAMVACAVAREAPVAPSDELEVSDAPPIAIACAVDASAGVKVIDADAFAIASDDAETAAAAVVAASVAVAAVLAVSTDAIGAEASASRPSISCLPR